MRNTQVVHSIVTRYWLFAVLLTAGLTQALWVIHSIAPTYDETGHLVAGLSHWRFSRFDLYSVNPPFARVLATLPLTVTRHREDWRLYNIDSRTRQEFVLGERLVKANGMHSTRLFSESKGRELVVLGTRCMDVFYTY